MSAAETVSQELFSGSHGCIGLVFIGTRRMKAINRKFLNHDYATDVICFSYEHATRFPHEDNLSGEIYICPAAVVEHANDLGVPPGEELLRVVIHGLLHLAGYEDATPADRRSMTKLQERLLGRLGTVVAALECRMSGSGHKRPCPT